MGSTLTRLRSLCPTLSVGILPADLMNMGKELAALERAGVGLIHVDVMDGCFCPHMTVGAPYVKGLRTSMLKEAHLMVRDPLGKLDDFVSAGSDVVTVHVEAATHVHRVLQHLGGLGHPEGPERGVVRGLALNPGTPLEWLTEPLLEEVDLISLLAVDPGWSGQRFGPATFDRIARVKEMVRGCGRDILICVDGGITRENLAEVAATGVDIIAAGSAVFKGAVLEDNAREMLEVVRGSAA